jgi:Ca2+-binding RTX toxin-like protein
MASLLAAGSSAASINKAGQPELCFGQVPTIIGTPGQSLFGTDGPDVVVTNGAYQSVDTGDGDDLVCVRREVEDGGYSDAAYLDTGLGNDRVDTTMAVPRTYDVIFLGAGADEFIGGILRDNVFAGEYTGLDTDVDAITTGGGPDTVVSDGGTDTIDLGRGGDQLILHGETTDVVLKGGSGENALMLDLLGVPSPHSWTLDNQAEHLLRDGQLSASWDNFSQFTVAAHGPIMFLGSAEDESLDFRDLGYDGEKPYWLPEDLEVHMRGGDDVVTFHRGAPGGRFNGGGGTDRFAFNDSEFSGGSSRISFDLEKGTLRDARESGKTISWRAVNFEDAKVARFSASVTMKGTDGPNLLKTFWQFGPTQTAILYGRAGNDLLYSRNGFDTLIGGSGHDTARGGNGIDQCEAEVRLSCEL